MTMPALASEAASMAAATASAKGDFMAVRLAWTHTLSFRVRACVRAGSRIPLPPMRALAYTTLSLRFGRFCVFANRARQRGLHRENGWKKEGANKPGGNADRGEGTKRPRSGKDCGEWRRAVVRRWPRSSNLVRRSGVLAPGRPRFQDAASDPSAAVGRRLRCPGGMAPWVGCDAAGTCCSCQPSTVEKELVCCEKRAIDRVDRGGPLVDGGGVQLGWRSCEDPPICQGRDTCGVLFMRWSAIHAPSLLTRESQG